jgi:D-alanyl-D-alanine carboxypeptidase
MTSGLPDYYTEDWLQDAFQAPERFQQAEAALRDVGQEPLLFSPGRAFDYSNTNYVLLGLILEGVTGKSYAQVMREEVFAPAGLTDSFVFGSQPLPDAFARGHEERALIRQYYSGNGFGDGGIIASARDMVSFYTALLGERRLLSEPMLFKLQTDPLGAAYGMGLEVEGDIVGHAGGDIGYSSDVRMDLETGNIAVFLIASEAVGTRWPRERLRRK